MQLSSTEENYVKAIFALSNGNKNLETSTNKIAAKIKTKPPTVTTMLQNLKSKKLITYERYKKVQLTSKGEQAAIQIVRKHRLWEVFLYEKLKFTWDEVHEIAEQLEHIISDKLTNRLDEFLGFPSSDPHGDPIPDKDGKLMKQNTQPLAVAPLQKKFSIAGINNSSDDFLKYLNKIGLAIGDTVKVVEKEDFDQSLTVLSKKNTIRLSHEAAGNLLVNDL